MANTRIETLLRLLETRPNDTRARFGLALEYERLEQWEEVAHHLSEYLREADDEGNAYGRMARALQHLGRDDEARDFYRLGIQAAERHGHPTLAMELEDELSEL